eukprot:1149413-Pelagomonas_calceolata.AAC.3
MFALFGAMLLGLMLFGAVQDALARNLQSGGDPGHPHPAVVYDEHGNAYWLSQQSQVGPRLEASSGPIYHALKQKATTGEQPAAYMLIPSPASAAHYPPPPPAPRAVAAANTPSPPTVAGSGGVCIKDRLSI